MRRRWEAAVKGLLDFNFFSFFILLIYATSNSVKSLGFFPNGSGFYAFNKSPILICFEFFCFADTV